MNYYGPQAGYTVWLGLLIGSCVFCFLGLLKDYTADRKMDQAETVCLEAGGVPARFKPNVLCFAPESFIGEPK